MQAFVKPFFRGSNDQKNGKPDSEKQYGENGGENKEHRRMERDPCVGKIAGGVGSIEGEKVTQEGFPNRPMLHLIKNGGACLNKGEKVGRSNGEEYVLSCEGEAFCGTGENEKDNSRNQGAEATEHQPSV